MKIHIEYCGGWGYAPRAFALRDAIKEGTPDADIECEVGRSQSFEVKINDKLVFSKLETLGECTVVKIKLCDNFGILGFPVDADILAQIENLKSGKDAVKVTTSQDGLILVLNSFTKGHCLIPVKASRWFKSASSITYYRSGRVLLQRYHGHDQILFINLAI